MNLDTHVILIKYLMLQAGKLRVQPFTHQTKCTLSRPNMCKGQILEDYISSRKEDGVLFSPIAYAGIKSIIDNFYFF